MTARSWSRISIGIILATLSLAGPARAGQPRPWLCRDKPVFSSDHAMNYDISARAGLQWQVFFMQYEPDAAHDGFDITESKELGLRGVTQSGKLAPGRYFTVAMYRQRSGVWVCHKYSRVRPNPKGVANICYGRDEPTCLVTLGVKNNMTVAAPVVPVPMP
ncbi:MAG TPA: hypothetical protein VNF29_05350 [Candidatus Binataceae bacterium]|nr:hypothetical protein [Candidatus Binataceae bacterium]